MKMEDIAKLAGVSKSAVSLTLNNKPGIGAETREKILRVVEEHGYVHKARGQHEEQAVRTLTFFAFANSGIVLEDYYEQPFFREIIQYIEERCRSNGYSLLFATVDPSRMLEHIEEISEEQRSDGIILLGTNLDHAQVRAMIEHITTPLVVLDNCYETLPVSFVSINNVMGAYQAGMHLCSLGHRHIGYLASNVPLHNFHERRKGFLHALQMNALSLEVTFNVAPTILSSQESLKKLLSEYLKQGNAMPTAFFCECDYIAISAIKTLSELGYRIPEDISIVGFDNITEAQIITPQLTTVHVEKQRLAHLAVDTLVQTILSPQQAKTKVVVDTQFITRSSTRAI